mmetsp:Transcript_40670/g.86524  ORF Transcript_40670/g.86524 Transcript_40670/m.86524 type:complete len:255 (+) Transcript_40670:201-965(+)
MGGLIEETPVCWAESERHSGLCACGHVHLLKSAERPQCRTQTWEAYIKLRHCIALAFADVDDLQGDRCLPSSARGRKALELKVRVSEAEAEWEGGDDALSVVPPIPDQHAFREVSLEVWAPSLLVSRLRLHPRILLMALKALRPTLLAELGEGHGEPPSRACNAGEELSGSDADLLAGHEEDEGCVSVVDPLCGDRTWHDGQHHDCLLRTREGPKVCEELRRLRDLEAAPLALPVPTLLRMRCNADHDHLGSHS